MESMDTFPFRLMDFVARNFGIEDENLQDDFVGDVWQCRVMTLGTAFPADSSSVSVQSRKLLDSCEGSKEVVEDSIMLSPKTSLEP